MLKDEKICIGEVNNISEAFRCDEIKSLNIKKKCFHPITGYMEFVGPPIYLSDSNDEIRIPPPKLGEHSEEILLNLGYGHSEIEKLRNDKVI